MIVTVIAINSDTHEDAVAAIEALAEKLRERGLADTEKLYEKNTLVTDHAVVMYSLKEES
jgi:hypothetical protein